MKYLGVEDDDIEATIGSVMHPTPKLSRGDIKPPRQ
jgi:hypothetical protein